MSFLERRNLIQNNYLTKCMCRGLWESRGRNKPFKVTQEGLPTGLRVLTGSSPGREDRRKREPVVPQARRACCAWRRKRVNLGGWSLEHSMVGVSNETGENMWREIPQDLFYLVLRGLGRILACRNKEPMRVFNKCHLFENVLNLKLTSFQVEFRQYFFLF